MLHLTAGESNPMDGLDDGDQILRIHHQSLEDGVSTSTSSKTEKERNEAVRLNIRGVHIDQRRIHQSRVLEVCRMASPSSWMHTASTAALPAQEATTSHGRTIAILTIAILGCLAAARTSTALLGKALI